MGTVVTASGTVVTGRAVQLQHDAADAWAERLATLGASMVRTNLNSVLRKQTPYYLSLIHI